MSARIAGFIRHNVVGLIAIFIALGGTAYASNEWTGDNIVDGSLASADYKNNNIKGVDVADGGLNASDLAENAIPSNDSCPFPTVCFSSTKIADNAVGASEISAGAVGSPEAANLTGSDIKESTLDPAELPGPVARYAFDDDTGSLCSDYCTEASLGAVPPGTYLVLAKITISQNLADAGTTVQCQLVAGGDLDVASFVAAHQDPAPSVTLPMEVVHAFTARDDASIECKAGPFAVTVTGSWAKITAIKLGSVS